MIHVFIAGDWNRLGFGHFEFVRLAFDVALGTGCI